jgi:hypothetical protein
VTAHRHVVSHVNSSYRTVYDVIYDILAAGEVVLPRASREKSVLEKLSTPRPRDERAGDVSLKGTDSPSRFYIQHLILLQDAVIASARNGLGRVYYRKCRGLLEK